MYSFENRPILPLPPSSLKVYMTLEKGSKFVRKFCYSLLLRAFCLLTWNYTLTKQASKTIKLRFSPFESYLKYSSHTYARVSSFIISIPLLALFNTIPNTFQNINLKRLPADNTFFSSLATNMVLAVKVHFIR